MYELYLAGRQYFNDEKSVRTRRAVESFEQALHKDPGFAPAYGMLALAYWQQAQRGVAQSKDVQQRIRFAAAKAVELDESRAEGHVALAFSKMWLDFDWAGSERERKRALELNPNEPLAYVAWGLNAIGRREFEEAGKAYRKKLEIDPGSTMSTVAMAYPLMYAGRYDEAIEWLRKAIDKDPNIPVAYSDLARVFDLKGQPDRFVEYSLKFAALSGAPPEQIAMRWNLFHKEGIEGFRREHLNRQLGRRERGDYVSPVLIAWAYMDLNEVEKALDWFEKAVDVRTFQVLWLKSYPGWVEKLKNEPRYHGLLRRMGLEVGSSL